VVKKHERKVNKSRVRCGGGEGEKEIREKPAYTGGFQESRARKTVSLRELGERSRASKGNHLESKFFLEFLIERRKVNGRNGNQACLPGEKEETEGDGHFVREKARNGFVGAV